MTPIPPRLIVLSGAGLSAESGLRTFRGSNGLWEGERIEKVCHADTWRRNLDDVHRFYNERRTQLAGAVPNAAHHFLARWEDSYRATIITQNVDDLLERAGCRRAIHLHGRLTEMRCEECGHIWDIGYEPWQLGESCPRAPRCKHPREIRPNIVFFGEAAPAYADLWRAFSEINPADVVVIIGTSGVVLPIDAMVSRTDQGAVAILNNLHLEEGIDDTLFTHVFREPATQAAMKIDAILRNHFGLGLSLSSK